MSILSPFLSRVIHRGRLTVIDPDGGAETFGAPAPGFPEVSVRFATRRAMRRVRSAMKMAVSAAPPMPMIAPAKASQSPASAPFRIARTIR